MKTVKNIFIVDDDPMQAMMLQDYLSKYSTFDIKVFHSGEECMKNIALDPQIVFLDYNFDKAGKDAMNGTEILKEIKGQEVSSVQLQPQPPPAPPKPPTEPSLALNIWFIEIISFGLSKSAIPGLLKISRSLG